MHEIEFQKILLLWRTVLPKNIDIFEMIIFIINMHT